MSHKNCVRFAMLASLSAGLLAHAAAADIIVTEIHPSGSGNSPYAADFFELTNTGTTAVNITGWAVDDGSNAFATARALLGVTSIPAGASVIFIETANLATTRVTFINTWFGGNAPAGLLIGSYSGAGIGLSTDGDAVNIFNSAGVRQAGVTFGSSTSHLGTTFDNAAGLSGLVSQISVVGVNGAFTASSGEIGSPGVIPTPAAAALLGLGALTAGRRRR